MLNSGPIRSPYKLRMDLTGDKNSLNTCQYLLGTSGKHLNALDTNRDLKQTQKLPKQQIGLIAGLFEAPIDPVSTLKGQ